MLIIDRFEENQAVIEFGDKFFVIPRLFLPADAREGDVITLTITVNKKATKNRAKAIKSLAEDLFED